jgi:hypothetical protein
VWKLGGRVSVKTHTSDGRLAALTAQHAHGTVGSDERCSLDASQVLF